MLPPAPNGPKERTSRVCVNRCQSLEKELEQYRSTTSARHDQTVLSKWLGITDIPTCYVLVIAVVIGLGISLALSLWYSIIHEDVSGGFTIGSYVIAAVGFLIAIPGSATASHATAGARLLSMRRRDETCLREVFRVMPP